MITHMEVHNGEMILNQLNLDVADLWYEPDVYIIILQGHTLEGCGGDMTILNSGKFNSYDILELQFD